MDAYAAFRGARSASVIGSAPMLASRLEQQSRSTRDQRRFFLDHRFARIRLQQKLVPPLTRVDHAHAASARIDVQAGAVDRRKHDANRDLEQHRTCKATWQSDAPFEPGTFVAAPASPRVASPCDDHSTGIHRRSRLRCEPCRKRNERCRTAGRKPGHALALPSAYGLALR